MAGQRYRHGGDLVPDQCVRRAVDRELSAWCRTAVEHCRRPATTTATATADILWMDGNDNVAAWFMNGATITSTVGYGNVGTAWAVQSQRRVMQRRRFAIAKRRLP